MRRCEVCDSESLVLDSVGFLTCQECGTQSQLATQEETALLGHSQARSIPVSTLLGGNRQEARRKRSRKRSRRTAQDLQRDRERASVVLLEALQAVLKRNLQEVEAMGCAPEVSQVGRSLWFYLLEGWRRSGWGADSAIVKVIGAFSRTYHRQSSVSGNSNDADEEELQSKLSDEHTLVFIAVSNRNAAKEPGAISIAFPLAIVSIACHLLCEPLSLNHLVRLALNEYLTFSSAFHSLDLSLKQKIDSIEPRLQSFLTPRLTDNDQNVAKHFVPAVLTICKFANIVAPGLIVEYAPRSVPTPNIGLLAVRLVLELKLPKELIPALIRLFALVDSFDSKTRVLSENIAIAFTGILLKLCFGSRTGEEFPNIDPSDFVHKLPSFEEWRRRCPSYVPLSIQRIQKDRIHRLPLWIQDELMRFIGSVYLADTPASLKLADYKRFFETESDEQRPEAEDVRSEVHGFQHNDILPGEQGLGVHPASSYVKYDPTFSGPAASIWHHRHRIIVEILAMYEGMSINQMHKLIVDCQRNYWSKFSSLQTR